MAVLKVSGQLTITGDIVVDGGDRLRSENGLNSEMTKCDCVRLDDRVPYPPTLNRAIDAGFSQMVLTPDNKERYVLFGFLFDKDCCVYEDYNWIYSAAWEASLDEARSLAGDNRSAIPGTTWEVHNRKHKAAVLGVYNYNRQTLGWFAVDFSHHHPNSGNVPWLYTFMRDGKVHADGGWQHVDIYEPESPQFTTRIQYGGHGDLTGISVKYFAPRLP